MLYKYIVKDSKKKKLKDVFILMVVLEYSQLRKQNKFLFDLIKSYGKISGRVSFIKYIFKFKRNPLYLIR